MVEKSQAKFSVGQAPGTWKLDANGLAMLKASRDSGGDATKSLNELFTKTHAGIGQMMKSIQQNDHQWVNLDVAGSPAAYFRLGNQICTIRTLEADTQLLNALSLKDAATTHQIVVEFNPSTGVTFTQKFVLSLAAAPGGFAADVLMKYAAKRVVKYVQDKIAKRAATALSKVIADAGNSPSGNIELTRTNPEPPAAEPLDIDPEVMSLNDIYRDVSEEQRLLEPREGGLSDDALLDIVIEDAPEVTTTLAQIGTRLLTLAEFGAYLVIFALVTYAIESAIEKLFKSYKMILTIINLSDLPLSIDVVHKHNLTDISPPLKSQVLTPVLEAGQSDPNSPFGGKLTNSEVSFGTYGIGSDSNILQGIGVVLKLTNVGEDQSQLQSIVAGFDIGRWTDNRVKLLTNKPDIDFGSFYDTMNDEPIALRRETNIGDYKIIATFDALSDAENDSYNATLIIENTKKFADLDVVSQTIVDNQKT